MPVVRMPDGALVDLPDQPTPQQLEGLRKLSAASQFKTPPDAPAPSFTDNLKRQLGLFARAGTNVATGTGTMLLDASDAIAKFAGLVPHSQTKPSARFQQSLTETAGLPEPSTPEEKVVGFATEVVGGALDPAGKAIQLASAAKNVPAGFRTASEQVDDIARELRKAGISINPTQSGGKVSRTVSAFGGAGRVNQDMRADNAERLTELVKQANKIPQSSSITIGTLKAQAGRLAQEGYEPVEKLQRVPMGPEFYREVNKILTDLADNRSFPNAAKSSVREAILENITTDKAKRLPVMSFTGKDAIKRIRELREEVSELYRKGEDAPLAATKDRLAKALEDQIERHLTSLGRPGAEILGSYRDTRAQLAKNFATRRIIDPDTGVVKPAAAHAMRVQGEKLTDELDLIAKAGSSSFTRSTAPPEVGRNPVSLSDIGFVGGGALGADLVSSGGLFAAIPFMQYGARKAVESKTTQKMLAAQPLFSDMARQRQAIGAARQLAPYSLYLDPTYAGEQ